MIMLEDYLMHISYLIIDLLPFYKSFVVVRFLKKKVNKKLKLYVCSAHTIFEGQLGNGTLFNDTS